MQGIPSSDAGFMRVAMARPAPRAISGATSARSSIVPLALNRTRCVDSD